MLCSTCGYTAPPLDPRPFRCPNSVSDGADHVLRRSVDIRGTQDAFLDPEPNPFVRYRRLTHTWATAMAMGMTDDDYVALVRRVGGWIERPSFEARQLMGLMIWIEVMKLSDAWLATADGGSAAVAAATIARAAGRNLDVFVPAEAPQAAVAPLEELGAHVTRCPRRRPPVQLFREAVAGGAFPFTCDPKENALAIEGGLTIGWELVSQLLSSGETADRVVAPAGTDMRAAFEDAHALGLIRRVPDVIESESASAVSVERRW